MNTDGLRGALGFLRELRFFCLMLQINRWSLGQGDCPFDPLVWRKAI